MRQLKVGIRSQLIVLVIFACLLSLLILLIVCGIYFSSNLGDLRAERLEVISQLKTSQVTQALDYLRYQIYWLTTRDDIYTPLSSYRAGNNSQGVFEQSQSILDQFLTNSESFAAARLYNLDLDVVAESTNNATSVSTPLLDYLYPLQQNLSIPDSISLLGNDVTSFYITGPVSNNSESDSAYFIGITYAVYANSSIIINTPSIAGYLTVITDANNIQQAVNETTSASEGYSNDYNVMAIEPVFESVTDVNSSDKSQLIGFQPVFPVKGSLLDPNVLYSINESSAIKEALYDENGSSRKKKNIDNRLVAIGFSTFDIDQTKSWSIIVEQKMSTFNAPIEKFTKIIIGVSIGIGAFVCLITFPLTVFFIRPITNLKEATEAITRSKRERERHNEKGRHSGTSTPPPSYYSTLIRRFHPKLEELEKLLNEKDKDTKESSKNRISVYSSGTGGSNSVYSTGIRLPSRIPNTKKIFKDELSELTEAFNIMREELEKQYVHLEDRVKSRTKELEASKIEAEAANEAKTVFIANISHELRTPLNGILGMTSIAMDEEDTSTIKDSLKLINRSGELLLHILTELLTYSKNTLNRLKLEKSSFQVLEVAYQVQSIFSKLANDQRVFFKILLKPNSLRKLILFGDSNRIIQVVMNLVSNSLKFTPVDGKVDVTFKLLGEYDQETSRAHDYNDVYIIGHSKGASSYKHTDDEDEQIQEVSNNHSENNVYPPDNDNSSIVTLSTSQYQDVLFRSQFRSETKSLPGIPDISTSESSDTASEFNKYTDAATDSNGGDKPPLPPKSLATPPNMRPNALSTSGTGTTKRPSLASLNSFNSNELVKDEKVYKIKKFYKPKTWVLQIEVTDTGPGIEPSLQEKVFEPFIQGDQTLSRSYGGTGLGLSICRQLAKMMNGTMNLKSTLGVGSTFTFTVPLPQVGEILVPDEDMPAFCEDEFNPKSKVNRKVAFAFNSNDALKDDSNAGFASTNGVSGKEMKMPKIPHLTIPRPASSRKLSDDTEEGMRNHLIEKPHLIARSSTGTASSSDKPEPKSHYLLDDLKHLKILVAEDNMVNQEVIKRMLSLEGFTNITMASNGAEAVDNVKESLASNEVFDLIFMDVQMPKIDGLLATKMIRSNLHYDKPIIALTAFADESNAKECLNSGMSGFLAKPIRRTNLRKIINEFSPRLLSETVTTPQTHNSQEKRLGYDSTNASVHQDSPNNK